MSDVVGMSFILQQVYKIHIEGGTCTPIQLHVHEERHADLYMIINVKVLVVITRKIYCMS